MNQLFTYLNAQDNARSFLYQCYQHLDVDEQMKKSYQNGATFMHYIQHGLEFYNSGDKSNPIVRPVLYFYGMVHLLKGWLLTTRPDYPESTALLAHGVTSRKRKRKDYHFFDDEVKIQQQGLFPYLTKHIYHLHPFPIERTSMRLLFANIPELHQMWEFQQRKTLIPVGNQKEMRLSFPNAILDSYHLTKQAFLQRIQPFLPTIEEVAEESSQIVILLRGNIKQSNGPFLLQLDGEQIYFPAYRDIYFPYSEILSHYLILYNLSMLCRYETEWWGELMLSKADSAYPMIYQFLEITKRKIPYLIERELWSVYGD